MTGKLACIPDLLLNLVFSEVIRARWLIHFRPRGSDKTASFERIELQKDSSRSVVQNFKADVAVSTKSANQTHRRYLQDHDTPQYAPSTLPQPRQQAEKKAQKKTSGSPPLIIPRVHASSCHSS